MSSVADEKGIAVSNFRDALREQLVDAEARNHARRTRFRRGAAAAMVAALAGVGLFAENQLSPNVALADPLRYDRQGQEVTVRLVEDRASFEEVRTSLLENGVEVAIDEVPVAPSAVGKFITSAVSPGDSEVEYIGAAQGTFEGFRFNSADPPALRFSFGRLAKGNEPYARSVDAYREGNLLHCSFLWGKNKADMEAFAAEKAIDVSFTTPLNANDQIVTEAEQTSARSVIVTLSPTDQSTSIIADSTGPTDCR